VRTRTSVALHEFGFPFSGRNRDTLTVDATGSIGFGDGVTIGRFDQLQNAARADGSARRFSPMYYSTA
jgi:hypothetical protein